MNLKAHNTLVIFSVLVPVILGYFVGDYFTSPKQAQVFKIYNLWGISYDVIGIFLLSGFVIRSKRVQAVTDTWGGPLVLAVAIGIPAGAGIGAMFANSLELVQAFFFLLVAGMVVNVVSYHHDIPSLNNPEFRIKMRGPACLITGLLFQLIGAYLDLIGDLK